MARPKGQPKLGGRQKGTPNIATQQARAAIAQFVDGNAHRLQTWLDQVAEGVQDESGDYVVKPDPDRAFSLFQSVIEYHVPKLNRSEVNATVSVNPGEELAKLKSKSSAAKCRQKSSDT